MSKKPKDTQKAPRKMAEVIHKGWSTSQDEIAQPNSIITGANLRGEQPQEQPYVSKWLQRVTPEEARRLGIPERNELIISPVPRKKD